MAGFCYFEQAISDQCRIGSKICSPDCAVLITKIGPTAIFYANWSINAQIVSDPNSNWIIGLAAACPYFRRCRCQGHNH
jgi:hypothetical protein